MLEAKIWKVDPYEKVNKAQLEFQNDFWYSACSLTNDLYIKCNAVRFD